MSLPNLTACRSAQESLMRETVQIWRKSDTVSTTGGWQSAYSLNATTIGRIGPIGRDPSAREVASQLAVVMPYGVTLPYDSNVLERDRLVVGTRTFEVLSVLRRTFATALRCVCDEVL